MRFYANTKSNLLSHIISENILLKQIYVHISPPLNIVLKSLLSQCESKQIGY